MVGFFIVHPRTPYIPRVDRDFGLVLQEWANGLLGGEVR